MPSETLLGRVAGRVDEHVVGGGGGRRFAVVERRHFAAGGAMHDEAAAADIAGVRQHDFERERHGDGGVDRVAALLQDVDAGLGREGMGGNHHGVRRGGGPGPQRPGRGDNRPAANRRWPGYGTRRAAAASRHSHRDAKSEDLSHS